MNNFISFKPNSGMLSLYSSFRQLTYAIFIGAVEAKSYIVLSQLPADIYSKYIEDKKTSHMTGFTFVVISIVHLAGGKISEGILC